MIPSPVRKPRPQIIQPKASVPMAVPAVARAQVPHGQVPHGKPSTKEELARLLQEFGGDENEFLNNDTEQNARGGATYGNDLMQQPVYEDTSAQVLNDVAADESFPTLVYYIEHLSHLGEKARARLIARASAFQSKNQVFSNIVDVRDYQMAFDDFAYAQLLSKGDFTSFDMNTDYFTAEAIMEHQFGIRLRRSREALNLSMINTQRSVQEFPQQSPAHQEQQKLRNRIPFIGGYL